MNGLTARRAAWRWKSESKIDIQETQYSEDDYVMKTECKTVVVNLPRVGEWQIVGYEEVTE